MLRRARLKKARTSLIPRPSFLPKRLRICYMFKRKQLAKLCWCTWLVLHMDLMQAAAFDDASPGAAIALHSFADFQPFNLHSHLISTDGYFSGSGHSLKTPVLLAKIWRIYSVMRSSRCPKLKDEINDTVIENMLPWRHGRFKVYCEPTIWSNDE